MNRVFLGESLHNMFMYFHSLVNGCISEKCTCLNIFSGTEIDIKLSYNIKLFNFDTHDDHHRRQLWGAGCAHSCINIIQLLYLDEICVTLST